MRVFKTKTARVFTIIISSHIIFKILWTMDVLKKKERLIDKEIKSPCVQIEHVSNRLFV